MILRRSRPTNTSTLRSKGSNCRWKVASNSASRLKSATRKGDEDPQQRELAAGQRNCLAGLADKRAGVEIEDKTGKPPRRLPVAGRRSTLAVTMSRTVWHARPISPKVWTCRVPDFGNYMAITWRLPRRHTPFIRAVHTIPRTPAGGENREKLR